MSIHALGKIVSFTDPGQTRLGKIVEIFEYWRPSRLGHTPEQLLYHVRYLDLKTGLPMECPDKRCKGEHTCPIHGANVPAEVIKPVPDRDLAFYRSEGLIRESA